MRPDKKTYYLGVAKSVSERSPCLRRKFGALVVLDDSIVTTGYNGPARGVVNCDEVGCLKDELDLPSYKGYDHCPAVHAEENCVINAARRGAKIYGGDLYIYGEDPDGNPVPSHPCDRCKRVLINSGIDEVITMDQDEEIIRYDVDEWVDEDTQRYLEALEEARDKE